MRSGSPRALLATASVAVALAAADTYVVVLALTDMMAGVGLGIESLQRATPIVSGFLLGYVAVLPLIGRLADLLPRQRVLLGCLVVFVVGSVLTATAVELPVLVSGRVLQGVGGGGLVPATLALVADLWPPSAAARRSAWSARCRSSAACSGRCWGRRSWPWRTGGRSSGSTRCSALAPGRGGPGHRAPVPARCRAGPATPARPPRCWRSWPRLGLLTLLAPDRLVTGVTTGIPFVPLVGTSRVATPIGVRPWRWSACSRWSPPAGGGRCCGRRRAGRRCSWRSPSAALVLTFASADPEREVVGPVGRVLLPVGARRRRRSTCGTPARPQHPLVPRGVVRGRVAPALLVSLLVGAALVAVVVDVPVLARLTLTGTQTTAALVLVRFLLAVPVGAPARRCAAAAARAGRGRARRPWSLAAAGLAVMATWGTGLAATAPGHRRAGRWSASASAWPSPPSTPPRSPTRRPRPTVSPARWSSSPGWSAWSSGWPC